ncbi:helix-turn-helix domain protein [bacterium BMS3Bbin02]|nr:helix-turn-helix domain protein [bacterium BMS3Bbin02]
MYLTTKDLQQLVKVDKSTIYRMAEDGRLPAIKIGRQWRFRDEDIRRWLDEPGSPRGPESSMSSSEGSLISRHLVELFADLYGVMVVVTDINGHPLIDVVNPCGFFASLLDLPDLTTRCATEWAGLAEHPDLTPTWQESRFGFSCARAFLRSSNQLVGMVIAGGVRSSATPDTEAFERLATDLGIETSRLVRHHTEMYELDESRKAETARGLATLATHLSDLQSNPRQRSEQ